MEFTIIIGKLKILFHSKRSRVCTKMTTIPKDVKRVFALIKKNASRGTCDFETQKIFQSAKVFNPKLLSKKLLKHCNVVRSLLATRRSPTKRRTTMKDIPLD